MKSYSYIRLTETYSISMHSILITVCVSLCLVVLTSADAVAYVGYGYKLTMFNNDPGLREDTRQRLINTFFATM